MKWVFLVVILAVQGRKRRKLVCTTDSDIRECVTGNVQLVNQARRDMNDFMNVLNNTIIPTFEKTTADALRQAEELKPLAKEIFRKNERLSLRMDKIASDHQEDRQKLQDLKETIRENKASCLAASKNAKEEITKTEIAIAEKIKKINEEITEKEKDFQLALEKATAKVENENVKLLQSFEKLDQNGAEIRSLENQLTKFDNKFSRENETIKKKLEKHNRRVSEKTEEALEKVRGQMQDVDDKISSEKLLLDLQIEQLTGAIQEQKKTLADLQEEQSLLQLETRGKSSAFGVLEKSYNELHHAFVELGEKVTQKMNQTITTMSKNRINYQRYNNENLDEIRSKLSEIIENHNLQGKRVRENSNLTMSLILNEHMLNVTQSHQGHQILQLAQEAKRCTDETENIIRAFNEQRLEFQSQKSEIKELRLMILQEAAEVRAEKANVDARTLQDQINEAHKRIDEVHVRFLNVRDQVDKEHASIKTLTGVLSDLELKVPSLEERVDNIVRNSATKAELREIVEQMSKLKEMQEILKKTVLNQGDAMRKFQKTTLDSQAALSKEFEERLYKLEKSTSGIKEDFAEFNQLVRHKISVLETVSTRNAEKLSTLEETDNSYQLRIVQQQLRTSQRENEMLKKKVEALERQVDPVLLAFGDDPREKIRQICQQEMMLHGVIDSYSRGRN